MKYTIKQQIAAINKARKEVKRRKSASFIDKELDGGLNDAASTLSALNFIGQEKILIAPELIEKAKQLVKDYHDHCDVANNIYRIEEILNRLPK